MAFRSPVEHLLPHRRWDLTAKTQLYLNDARRKSNRPHMQRAPEASIESRTRAGRATIAATAAATLLAREESNPVAINSISSNIA